jgi:WD40 repeat protein
MEDESKNTSSIIPLGSTGLVRVSNSISLTSKLIEENNKRQLEKVKFQGVLITENNVQGSVISTASYQFEEFIASTNNSCSIFKYDAKRNQLWGKNNYNGNFDCVVFGFVFDAIASGRNIYISKNGKITNTLEGHNREIHTLLLSRDKKFLFSGSGDKSIRVWDTNTWECIKVLEGHDWLVNSLITDFDDRYLYSGGWDSFIIKWDLQTYSEVDRFYSGQIGGIKCIAISKNNQTIITGGGDQIVRLTDTKNYKIIVELKGHTDFVSCLAISEDNSLLASGGWDGSINIWHLDTRVLVKNLKAHSGHVNSISFSGEYLLSGGSDGFIKTWK